jgi:hypothetical protein
MPGLRRPAMWRSPGFGAPCLLLIVVLAGCAGSATSITVAPPASTAPTATAVPIDTGIKVFGDCMTPSIEPSEIVLTCADYGLIVEELRWTSWTPQSATAVGTLSYNDCTPSCAAGRRHDIPHVSVVLTAPVKATGGQTVWSEMQFNPQPPGYATGPFHGGPYPLPTQPD